MENARREVGGACLHQRMAERSLCAGVSDLVAQEIDRELEQHQVSNQPTNQPTNQPIIAARAEEVLSTT